MVFNVQLVDQRPGISITRKPARLAYSWAPPSPTKSATCAPTNLPGYFSICSRVRITSTGKAGQERNERKVKSADSGKVSEPYKTCPTVPRGGYCM